MKILNNLKLNKKILRELDYGVIIFAVCIVIFGCINIYSDMGKDYGIYYPKKQIIFMLFFYWDYQIHLFILIITLRYLRLIICHCYQFLRVN